MGIEEEFLVVHPDSRAPAPAGPHVAARAAKTLGDSICGEFTRYQIECRTAPCIRPEDLREELLRLRRAAAAAAAAEGLRICASGTTVLGQTDFVAIGDHSRYQAQVQQYRAMLEDFAVCAQHVHIHLPDHERAVLVSNHLRPWLPLLVALSANSPFHHGHDTGYADWRAVIRSRFPCLGPPPYAASLRHHQQIANAMAESEAMLDANSPLWDIRLNPHLPTLEIRCMDVTADVDDAVALAALIRALVTTASLRVLRGDPGPQLSGELLRAAYWRAARDGWSGSGVDALTGRIRPARAQAQQLFDHVRTELERHGDTDLVTAFLRRLALRGAGAERQRASAARHGALTAVVDDLIDLTTPS
jgi:carboxylate-amine ligase